MANRKWPRHKDPLNLSDEYDLTDYINSIPIVEETSSKISNNKAILKEKEKAHLQRKRDSRNITQTHLQQSIMNLFEGSMELHKKQKKMDALMNDFLYLDGTQKPNICEICHKLISKDRYTTHLLRIHQHQICFTCKKIVHISNMNLRLCKECKKFSRNPNCGT